MTPALFLDRDGTLIVDVGYPRDPALVEPIPGAIAALRELQAAYKLVIISNQSGIGRGLITEAEAQAVHERVVSVFDAAGVTFAGAYYCPHAPDASCRCRKPAPGLLLDAAAALGIDLQRSVMVGDKASDLAAGRAAGCGRVIGFNLDDDGDGSERVGTWSALVRCL
ncbi:MAG: HAD family hydrolase [Deltaproteobacteria bacterium]|nr:HAD family hydrolase [Deltaproteobacteria bacterium]